MLEILYFRSKCKKGKGVTGDQIKINYHICHFYLLFYQCFDTFVFVLIAPVYIIIYSLLCFWKPFICKGLYVSEGEDFMKMYFSLVDVGMFQWWQGCQNLLLWTKCQGHEERKGGGCLFGSTRWRLGLDGGSALFPGMSWSLLLETLI